MDHLASASILSCFHCVKTVPLPADNMVTLSPDTGSPSWLGSCSRLKFNDSFTVLPLCVPCFGDWDFPLSELCVLCRRNIMSAHELQGVTMSTPASTPSSSVQATVTKHHRWNSFLNSRSVLLTVLESGSLRPGCQHGLVRVIIFWG